ncbi:retropepsin-like aspartic protease family protein [Aestuariirhabdus litorea]|uniref:TIGR02281 family clan AA aspartic protease n=1 Tax=Aestuariirhabdus litorea TaxID=2528527 RepID=A0A3P3VME8_9GAMM|nr:TIGR02281 family clan AA aspartic protease [Aestuariirhabdus litorea]RRJ83604.1 TIGR02281 family clan AA aspartic protease [Aestuariirhabdus litorea]RWW96825.1 TIGR02281 family clan AA aspartic protease [Endozoicomonadaceae bacterium GTF-13]
MVRARLWLFPLLWLPLTLQAAPEVRVQGLFPGAAVVIIDGERHLLKVGRKPVKGVSVLEADAQSALLLIEGQPRRLTLSREVNSRFTQAQRRQVRLSLDAASDSYPVFGAINGRPLQMVVDTGASLVAMSSQQAQILGLDYLKGDPLPLTTASDQVMGYALTLDRVSIGGIERRNVRAVVVEGRFPTQVLLGMSFLQHLRIEHQGSVLLLEERSP